MPEGKSLEWQSDSTQEQNLELKMMKKNFNKNEHAQETIYSYRRG